MKTIESKDLVIGELYYDIPDTDLEHAAVLRFLGYDKTSGDLFFKPLRGNVEGYKEVFGTLFFSKYANFYQPWPKSNLSW